MTRSGTGTSCSPRSGHRGFDHRVDLLSPGELTLGPRERRGSLVARGRGRRGHVSVTAGSRTRVWSPNLVDQETERRARVRPRRWHCAGDAYLVRRGKGKTIIAGYPWFTDWGRDTFIALRGLCLATGRLDDARAILLEWAGLVSEGMLPNRFVERRRRAGVQLGRRLALVRNRGARIPRATKAAGKPQPPNGSREARTGHRGHPRRLRRGNPLRDQDGRRRTPRRGRPRGAAHLDGREGG